MPKQPAISKQSTIPIIEKEWQNKQKQHINKPSNKPGEIITKHAKNPKLEEPVHSSLEPTKPNLQLVLITKTKPTNKIKTSANTPTPLAIITTIIAK